MIRNEDTGDLWNVRTCDECNGIVVERWIQKRGKPLDEDTIDRESPDDVMDIPRLVLEAMIEELKSPAQDERE